MRTILCSLFLVLLTATLQAQTPARYVWGGISANNYRGDLEDGLPHYGPAVHLGMKLNKAKRLNGNLAFSYGELTGQNPDFTPAAITTAQPNRYFSTSFFSLEYSLQYHLLKKNRYLLYLSQGVGLFRYSPKDEQDQELADQGNSRPAGETYGAISLMLPTGVGAAYLLPNKWGIGIQAAYLNTLTDFIDNISSLGTDKGNDNVLQFRLMLMVPLQKEAQPLTTP